MFSRDRAKSHQAEGQEKTGCCGFTMINKNARSRKGGQRHKIMIEGEAKHGREVLSLQLEEQKNNGSSSIHYQNITLKGPRMYIA